MSNQSMTTELRGLEHPYQSDYAGEVLCVPGRWTHRTVKPGRPVALWFHQRFVTEARPVKGYGPEAAICAEVRFDDTCGNGHNTFAITGTVRTPEASRRGDIAACGCLHDDISRVFPELVGLIKWHLTSTDGPMHYIANTVYMAGDRDHNGLRAGEPQQIRDGRTGLPCWGLRAATPDGTGSLRRLSDTREAEERPTDIPELRWMPWERIGEGKARQLDAARAAAVWPDATDAELMQEPEQLRAVLAARLPQLLIDFRRDIEAAGFLWSAEVTK